MRQYSWLDRCIEQLDAGLQTVFGQQQANRPDPAVQHEEAPLSVVEKRHAAGLMRVNHAGEVCAQALYRGQLVCVKTVKTKEMLQHACMEETDHLAWTDARLQALDSHRSYLNGFWYVNSFCMGALAAWAGDSWSLGFVEETEAQVAQHLQNHLQRLPQQDKKSRVVVSQMQADEEQHGAAANAAGGRYLPRPIRFLMRCHAKVMTTLSYYV